MSAVLPEDQLIELLVQLQKTTPDQTRAILNAQPAIGSALVPLMLRMGVVNLEVLQNTLAAYSAAAQQPPPAQTQVQTAPVPAVPAHLTGAAYHHPTPPPLNHNHTPTPLAGVGAGYPAYPPPQDAGQHAAYAYAQQYLGQGQQQQQQYQQQQQQQQQGAAMLGALGNIPDDQRETIMRVISMTPEQVNRLPPQDRAITIQLRATLGLPTE